MVSVQDRALQILIVEDDDDTAEVIDTLMRDLGYETHIVENGEQALNALSVSMPDLVLLDLNLPDINGLDILRQVRSHSHMPMIVISGFGKDRDRVVALEVGADDFLSKPFSPDELIARVRALLRRVEWTPKVETKLVVRRLELDMPRRQATIRGRRLHLTPIEYSILALLMRRAGKVVTHEDLIHAVWGDDATGDFSVLRVNISRLRQKLEENPRSPTYIVTVPGQGYWMPTRRNG